MRTNLLAADFLPLHLQRFQLAVYGMENFNPQSTDWLRVTLFSGAPRIERLGRRHRPTTTGCSPLEPPGKDQTPMRDAA